MSTGVSWQKAFGFKSAGLWVVSLRGVPALRLLAAATVALIIGGVIVDFRDCLGPYVEDMAYRAYLMKCCEVV